MPSPLLSIALGALQGASDNREKKKRDEQADLENEIRLRSTPGITLEPTGARAAADVAQGLGGILGAGAGVVAPIGVGGGTAPGQAAGTAHIGDRSLDVRFDPTQTAAGRQAAKDQANRAAHAELAKLDPTSWGDPYDPTLEYGEALRGEKKKADVEKQLIAAGYTPDKARLYARTGIDADKRAADIDRTKAEAEKARRPDSSAGRLVIAGTKAELDKEKNDEQDAGGTALGWAMNGDALKIPDTELQQQIADALAPMYPKLSYAQRVGVAARAIAERTKKAADVGAKNRSGTGSGRGMKIPGVDLSKLPTAAGVVPSTARSSSSSSKAPLPNAAAAAAAGAADKAKARKAAIEDLAGQGKTREEIKAELAKRGLI